jgi:MFS family permease
MAASLVRRLVDPIVASLRAFRGNARVCILVEPMWGIPYNLFVPYASLYMLALGVDEKAIGLVAALSMAMQTFWSLTAGWITDRFGRRRTSLVVDLISWSLPTLIWAFARDLNWFLAAAVLNSLVRIVHISWSCLFIEDAPPESRVSLYAWIAVAGTLSGFFAPLAGLVVNAFGVVPATRGLYLFAFALMTTMFFVRNAFCVETAIGKKKMAEVALGKKGAALAEYKKAALALLSSKPALAAFGLAVLSNIHLMARANFMSVTLTKGIGLAPGLIAAFPPLASGVTLAVYFLVIPRIVHLRRALAASLVVNVAGNLLIGLAPVGGIWAVVLGTLLVAFGTGVTGPVVDAVLANSVDDATRATALSIVYTLMFALTAPFGWLGGLLAALSPRAPMYLAAATMAASLLLTLSIDKEKKKPNSGG